MHMPSIAQTATIKATVALPKVGGEALGGHFKWHLSYEESAIEGVASGRPRQAHIQQKVPAEADACILGTKPFVPCINRALADHGFRASGTTLSASAPAKH